MEELKKIETFLTAAAAASKMEKNYLV